MSKSKSPSPAPTRDLAAPLTREAVAAMPDGTVFVWSGPMRTPEPTARNNNPQPRPAGYVPGFPARTLTRAELLARMDRIIARSAGPDDPRPGEIAPSVAVLLADHYRPMRAEAPDAPPPAAQED